jgi:hypothetical protein
MNILGINVSVDKTNSKAKWTRRAVAIAGANALVLAGGTAYAAWSVSGSGTGGAVSGSASSLQLTAATTGSNALFPGQTADVVITITNPNPFVVDVSQLTLPAATSVATAYTDAALTSAKTACNTGGTGVSWSYTTKNLTGVVVDKKTGGTDGVLTLTLSGAATMSSDSDNNCQSAFFKMPNVSTVTAASSALSPVATATK